MKKQDFQQFLKCLMKAIQTIDFHYFQMHFAGSDELKYRERVYCYELYHQLRLLLGDDFPYKLDGELDKKSHEIISGEEAALKPGNTLPLRNIPEGSSVYNIELKKGKGGQLVRSAGAALSF